MCMEMDHALLSHYQSVHAQIENKGISESIQGFLCLSYIDIALYIDKELSQYVV